MATAQDGDWQGLRGEGGPLRSQIQPLRCMTSTSVPWLASGLGHSPRGQQSAVLGGARARGSRRGLYFNIATECEACFLSSTCKGHARQRPRTRVS